MANSPQTPTTKILTDLHPSQITLCDTFWYRSGGLQDFHVATLRKTLRATGRLDPIMVWQETDKSGRETGRLVLLDGRHRLEAYKQCKNAPVLANLKEHLPAFIVKADPMEARIAALQVNVKDALALTMFERTDAAWKLVWDYGNDISKAKTSRSSAVSIRTIARMRFQRQMFRQHGQKPSGDWQKDRLFPQEAPEFTSPTDAEREAMITALTEDVKEAVRKHRCRDTEIMAEAIERAFGQKKLMFMVSFLGIGGYEHDEFSDDLEGNNSTDGNLKGKPEESLQVH